MQQLQSSNRARAPPMPRRLRLPGKLCHRTSFLAIRTVSVQLVFPIIRVCDNKSSCHSIVHWWNAGGSIGRNKTSVWHFYVQAGAKKVHICEAFAWTHRGFFFGRWNLCHSRSQVSLILSQVRHREQKHYWFIGMCEAKYFCTNRSRIELRKKCRIANIKLFTEKKKKKQYLIAHLSERCSHTYGNDSWCSVSSTAVLNLIRVMVATSWW